jgi:soluble lytic murein transglycosylase-like protein
MACASRPAQADGQTEPELRSLLERVAMQSACFSDRFESEVWHKTMEPRLRHFVANRDQRLTILDNVYCEARRDPTLKLPPDLVLAIIEVESRFDPWAVSPVGAVGLMQVMPFWPKQLGIDNQLVRAAANIRIGCEILRFYLRREAGNWRKALARYNGSIGRNAYAERVLSRWHERWRY